MVELNYKLKYWNQNFVSLSFGRFLTEKGDSPQDPNFGVDLCRDVEGDDVVVVAAPLRVLEDRTAERFARTPVRVGLGDRDESEVRHLAADVLTISFNLKLIFERFRILFSFTNFNLRLSSILLA